MSETKTAEPVVRILWPVTGVVIALGVVYGVLWALLATGLRDVALDWIEDQRRIGWAIAHDAPELHGFPSWPKVILTSVSVTAPVEDGGWVWKADGLTLVPAAFNLTKLAVHTPGTHALNWPTLNQSPWTLTADHAVLDMDLNTDGKWQGAHLSLGRSELSDPLGRPSTGVARLDATVTVAQSTTNDTDDLRGDVSASFTGTAEDLRLALNLGPFDRTVRAFQLNADLVGPIRPGRLSEALEAWRNGGGTLEIKRLLLDWPPLTIDANGTLALDDCLQPIGAFSTRITGFNETIETMESRGVIPGSQAASAQLILGLMASTPCGGEPELTVPLSVQDRRLSVGPVELLDVPEVKWE